MDPFTALGILITSIFAGLLGSLLGLGGGIIIIPSLVLIFSVPMQEAVGASLVGVIATSTGAATYYVQEGICNIKLGMVLETATTVGSVVGALIAVYIDESLLALAFALLLVYSSVHMMRRTERLTVPEERDEYPSLSTSFIDKRSGEEIRYGVKNLNRGLIGSFFAGNLSGMLGVGGGTIKVPVMNLWMNVPMKAAAATSNFMIGVTALSGAVVFYAHGLLSPVITATVATGVFFGAITGSRTVRFIKTRSLRILFAAVMVIIAVLMILKAVGLISVI